MRDLRAVWICALVLGMTGFPAAVIAQSGSDSLPEPDAPATSESESETDDLATPEEFSDSGESAEKSSETPRRAPRGDGEQCNYHVDCSGGHVCVRGKCIRTENAIEYMSANEACGQDRRCRINRLKRKNRARRHAQLLEEERKVNNMIDQYQQEEIEDYPRIDRPFSIDVRMSRFGLLGLAAGYTFFGRLHPELQFSHKPAYSTNLDVDDRDFDGTQSVTWFIPGIMYFFSQAEFVPYLGLSFAYGFGRYDHFGGGLTEEDIPDQIDTEYHALELKGGVDYQMKKQGAHLRLGLAYRPLIYNQARLGPGDYSEPTRRAMKKWFRRLARIDVLVLAGWAF